MRASLFGIVLLAVGCGGASQADLNGAAGAPIAAELGGSVADTSDLSPSSMGGSSGTGGGSVQTTVVVAPDAGRPAAAGGSSGTGGSIGGAGGSKAAAGGARAAGGSSAGGSSAVVAAAGGHAAVGGSTGVGGAVVPSAGGSSGVGGAVPAVGGSSGVGGSSSATHRTCLQSKPDSGMNICFCMDLSDSLASSYAQYYTFVDSCPPADAGIDASPAAPPVWGCECLPDPGRSAACQYWPAGGQYAGHTCYQPRDFCVYWMHPEGESCSCLGVNDADYIRVHGPEMIAAGALKVGTDCNHP